jgi:hypothetical protein
MWNYGASQTYFHDSWGISLEWFRGKSVRSQKSPKHKHMEFKMT